MKNISKIPLLQSTACLRQQSSHLPITLISLVASCWLLLASFSNGQGLIEWQNTIGGSGWDALTSVQQTADGGYILGGNSSSGISGDKTENSNGCSDYWIVKTDSVGNIQWQNTIGGSGNEGISSIQQTADGGYILGGSSDSNISGDKTENCFGVDDYWIVKTDSLGNIQWQNTIGGSFYDVLNSIQQTADGGYILGGYSWSDISGDKTENTNGYLDYWIVKTDSLGNIQWQNTIGGSDGDWINSIRQTADGGFILGGSSWSNISGDKTENSGLEDYWIVKTDSIGNIQWQNTIGGSDRDWINSIQQTADGGYILGGTSWSDISGDKSENAIGNWNPEDYWIVKTDTLGNVQWQNTIGGSDIDKLKSILQTADGGYILGGYSWSGISGDKTETCFSNCGDPDYWIVKTDALGNIQWENTIGGDNDDELYSLQQTADGGYILGGMSDSNISFDKTENSNGGNDIWIVKIVRDFATGTSNDGLPISDLKISPNPANEFTIVNYSFSQSDQLLLTDIAGRTMMTKTFSSPELNYKLYLPDCSPGIYMLHLLSGESGMSGNAKLVISK